MDGDVPFQVGDADGARVEHAIGTEQWNLHIFRTIFAEAIDAERDYVGVKLLHAAPDESETAERLIARERVAAGGLDVFHVAAENRGEKPSEELRDGAD